MNTLVSVSIVPFGIGDELSKEVAEIVNVIQKSGLPNRTTAMSTEIEGEWDEVMQVIKEATCILTERGIRTIVSFKADIRPGYTNTLDGKIERLQRALEKLEDRS